MADRSRRDGLLLIFGLIDHLCEAQARELMGWIRNHDLLAAFGFTPPGEVGVAGRHSRSFRHMVRLITKAGLSIAALSRFDMDPVQFAFAVGPNERPTSSFCIHTAVVGSRKQIAKAEQRLATPILALNEVQAEAFEQENLLRLHYSHAFGWTFGQLSACGEARADLVRQITEWQQGTEDLVRQITEWQQGDAELRRQLKEQVARSEDLSRQVAEYRTALNERERSNAELRHKAASGRPPEPKR